MPARAAMLARMGFVVLTYDMVGYNDTKQTPHSFGNEAERLWNWGPMGLQLWNSIRAADFLSALPDVDGNRLGATGASGGGTQTFLLTAIDDRIRWSAPVNMISGIMQGGSPCENGPGLRAGTFNVEIGALMAPRPMLMISATGDWTKNTPRQEYPAIRRIYALYGKESELESKQIDAPHNYNLATRTAVYDFFARKALGLSAGPRESNIPQFDKGDLLSLEGRELPAGALNYEGVYAQFQKSTKQSFSRQASRDRLRAALLAEYPSQAIGSNGPDGVVVMGRPGRGDRVVGRWVGGTGSPVLVVDSEGIEKAAENPRVKELIASGRRVMLLNTFQVGASRISIEEGRHYLTFQRSNAANRAQDILTAIRYLEQQRIRPELLGIGDGEVWVAVAAAMAPRPPRLLSMPDFKGTDEEWIKHFNAPGIQWAGGWDVIRALLR